MTEELLNLSTLTDHASIVIDGDPYELRNESELGLVDYVRLQSAQAKLIEFVALESPTDKQSEETSAALDAIVALVLPDAPRDKLTDTHKAMIVDAATTRAMAMAVGAAGDDGHPTKPPTGGSRSRASKRSTAAAQTTGS